MREDLFDSLIITSFPYPLAVAFRRIREDRDSREALCGALHQFLAFVGQIQLLDFLGRDERPEELTADLRGLLERPPTAGTWLTWIEKIAALQRKEGATPLLDHGDTFTARASRRSLHGLVEDRNRWAHGAVEFKVPSFRRALFEAAGRVKGLHTSSLFCPETARVEDRLHVFKAVRLQGDYAQLGEIEGRSSVALESGRVHFYTRGTRELVSLYPFAQYARCGQCERMHYFQFDRARNRKIAYLSIGEGHERVDAEAWLHLERLFRQTRPRRESPRHFSIPGDFGNLPRTLGAGDAVGPYKVQELIKIGGMAQVYRARDTRDGAEYALKILPLELSRDPLLVTRFDEEAHNMRKVVHPNVVKLHDFGEDFGDRYLVFELARGGTVGGQQVIDLSDVKGSLPEAEIVRIGRQVCEALQSIHAQGILHRDLKPGNLLVSGDRVLAGDFGISRARGESGVTLTGLPVGTPEYMSPEQVQQGELTPRSDLYALGCILYELATGRPPFRSDTPLTTAMYQLQGTPPRIEDLNPKISQGLCNVIYKLMQKAPRLRHGSARELYEDLASAASDPAGPQIILGQKMPQDALEETRARERQHARRRLLLVSGVFVLLLLALVPGRLAWNRWRYELACDRAEEAWESGTERWPEACAALWDARVLDPTGARFEEVLQRVSLHGRLRLESPQEGVGFHLATGFDSCTWPERLQALRSSLELPEDLAPGQEVVLPIGSYRVTPVVAGRPRDDLAFPVCLTQRLFDKGPDAWEEGSRLPPGEALALDLAPLRGEMGFAFGERFLCENLVFPDEIPDGFRYVNPGPFFRAENDFEKPTPWRELEPDGNGRILEASFLPAVEVIPDVLTNGFLMGNEVTRAEFVAWFERFGHDFAAGMVETERVDWMRRPLGWIREALRYVPLDVQLRYWAEHLPPDVDPAAITSSDQLVEAAFRERYAEARDRWRRYEEDLRQSLARPLSGDLPVTGIDYHAAVAFARTHRPVLRGDLRRWLESEIAIARDVEASLQEFRRRFERVEGDSLRGADFPSDSHVWWREPLPRRYDEDSFLGALIDTLYYHTHYPWHAPAEAVRRWTLEHPERVESPEFRERLDEFREGMAREENWLYAREAGLLYVGVLSNYTWDVQEQDAYPRQWSVDRAATRIRIERARAARLGEWETRLQGGSDGDVVDELPWDLRLEFGLAQGWDLPEDRQWEKAARGADDRPYVWGRSFSEAVLGDVDGPFVVQDAPTFDMSPHGLMRMGSQVSEWVHLRPGPFSNADWLKGGNYRFDGSVCNTGHLIRVPRGQVAPWAGFRVVRELRVAPAEDPD